MTIGKVTVWKMSEKERLAYIAKHPIRTSKKPKGVAFSNIHTGERKRKTVRDDKERITDNVDMDRLHKMFLEGVRLADIAKALNLNKSNLDYIIRQQRKSDLDKWPRRKKRKGVD